ncbi:MAG: efflux RND transporter periplasmic adaptor subunit [Lachnospiraceae bacterium]|nr:efflux RND transporter periplasmic adaptor subunit [Lachnospiraceae bacterium]
MQKGRIVITVIAAAVLIGGAGFLTAFGMGSGKQHEVAFVSTGSIAGSVKESGNIDGNEEYEYFARVSAPVKTLKIKVGDIVKAGQIILTYDTSDYERSVSEAAISREQSEEDVKGKISKSNEYSAKYNKAVSDDDAYAVLYAWQRESSDGQDESQYSESWNIQCQKDSIQKDIAAKKEKIAEKEAEYEKLSSSDQAGDKGKKLAEKIADLNEDIAGLNKSLAGLPPSEMSPEEYAKYNDTSNVLEDINRNWTQAKTEKRAYEEGILNSDQKAALKKQTELAKSKEEAAKVELDKASAGVKTDVSGVVTECNIKEGSLAAEGESLFKIVNSEDLKVTVMISKYDIGDIKPGQRAEIDVSGKTYQGSVTRINHVATSDDSDKNKVAVDVSIEAPDEDLILGIEADVTIFTDEHIGAVLIPYSAFYSDDDGDYCYVIEEGVITKKYFTAGIENGESVEVKEGLKEGEAVITDAVTDEQIGDKATYAVH